MANLINLLPDVRQAKLHEERRRRTVWGIGTAICTVSIGLVVVLFLITQAQNLQIAKLTSDIKRDQARLNEVENLSEMVTTQQHLKNLPALYAQRTSVTKLMSVLQTISPKELGLTRLEVEDTAMKLSGRARGYSTVTKLVRALEASNVTLPPNSDSNGQPHFSNVAITSVSSEGDGKVTFTVSLGLSGGVISDSSR